MNPIATYVLVDALSSGLPGGKDGEIEIIELCLLAVKVSHLLKTKKDEEPRVQYKLRMCFNPKKRINQTIGKKTGLNKTILKAEAEFNHNAFDTINTFINCLQPPICLIGHNALNFDFQLLQYHLQKLGVALSYDILCTDSLYAFYDILEAENRNKAAFQISANQVDTPKNTFKQLWRGEQFVKSITAGSYKLCDIYKQLVDDESLESDRAENHCIMIMYIILARTKAFVKWVQNNHCPFTEVCSMDMS